MAGYIGARSVSLSATVANAQDITATDTTPEVTIINNTHEDTDGGREGKVIFKGQQSGGEESTLAEIQASHDGTADDEKGDLIFRTNDGSDGASPTEAMRITSQQRVGIGTNDPSANLEIATSASDLGVELVLDGNKSSSGGVGSIIFNNAGDSVGMIRAAHSASDAADMLFYTQATGGANTERMRIDSSGKVGIGVSPDYPLHVQGTNISSGGGLANLCLTDDTAYNGSFAGAGVTFRGSYHSDGSTTNFGAIQAYKANTNNGNYATELRFLTRPHGGSLTTGMTINSSGLTYIPTAYSTTTGSGANMYIQSDGAFYRSTSSRRYKNTIEDATHGLSDLLKLRSVTYKGNEDGDTVFGGLIAEEVHEAGLTEFVQYNDDNEPDALSYGNMVSLCIKAIQEQQSTITAQATKIETLEKENTAIKARLDALEAE